MNEGYLNLLAQATEISQGLASLAEQIQNLRPGPERKVLKDHHAVLSDRLLTHLGLVTKNARS